MTNDAEERFDQLMKGLTRRRFDTDAWLAEDETAAYDRIVGQRQRSRRLTRWAAAAVAAGAFFLLGTLWADRRHAEAPTGNTPAVVASVEEEEAEQTMVRATASFTVAIQAQQAPTAIAPKRNSRTTDIPFPAGDSLDARLALIEQELDHVEEEVYAEHLQRIVAMDERLQRLVCRILMDEAEENTKAEYNERDENDKTIYF